MIRMGCVAVSVVEIVHVVAVLHSVVAAAGPMLVKRVILGGRVQFRGITLVVVVGVLVMGVPVVEIVHVVTMLYGGVTAGCCVGVRVVGVNRVRHISAPVRR